MTARDDLRAVALAHQAEIEALYRRMLADLPEDHSVTMNDLQNRDVVAVLGGSKAPPGTALSRRSGSTPAWPAASATTSRSPSRSTPPTPRTVDSSMK